MQVRWRPRVVYGAMAACIVLGCVVAWYFFSLPPSGAHSALRDEMRTHLVTDGLEGSYQWLLTTYTGKNFDSQHNAAHVYGETLFDVAGKKGMRVCDAQFNYGCYHGFLSRAISQEGLKVVARLDAECRKVDPETVCQHGIGHGILEYLGHTKINEALAVCDMTRQPDPLAGCTSGVFMEYNVPLMESSDGVLSLDPRPIPDIRNPHDICGTVAEKYRQSCYHELPQWWQFVYERDFATLGRFCEQVADLASQAACFKGIAKLIPSSTNYDPKETITRCHMLSSRDRVTDCIVDAAWSFESNIDDHEGALLVCAAVDSSLRTRCPQ